MRSGFRRLEDGGEQLTRRVDGRTMRDRVCRDGMDGDGCHRRFVQRERSLATHAYAGRFRFIMIAGMLEGAGRGSQQERTQQQYAQQPYDMAVSTRIHHRCLLCREQHTPSRTKPVVFINRRSSTALLVPAEPSNAFQRKGN